jgi:hypothetical protein
MADFEIKRSVTENDIPAHGSSRKSKYEPIITSARTLEVDEGIEVAVKAPHVLTQVRKLIRNRLPRRHYLITGRQTKSGHNLYIIRKS